MGSIQAPLSCFQRLYAYALHGFLIEVLFTAAWDFALHRQWTLAGCSNLWSLPIYGTSGLVMEVLANNMLASEVKWPLRGIIYLIWIYCWEFSTGLFLRTLGACPWDYSDLPYNVAGLITLEYAPLWLTVALLMERTVIKHVPLLHWHSNNSVVKLQ